MENQLSRSPQDGISSLLFPCFNDGYLVADVISAACAFATTDEHYLDKSVARIWKIWYAGHSPFEYAGSDTLVLATPDGNIVWSCDHAVLNQILTLHPEIEIPVENFRFFEIWGRTVGSVDGAEWKTHRRIITSGFGGAVNNTVWTETQQQTSMLVQHWIRKEDSVVPIVRDWTSKLALHVICSGFFNLHLKWDDSSDDNDTNVDEGFELPFDKALLLLLKRLATIYITPRTLLGKIPLQSFREANLGYTETTKYLRKLRAAAASNIEQVSKKKNKTLLEAIVLAGADPEISGRKNLSEDSVMGNLFFSLMAGHETTGATLGFACILMALYPEYQQRLQKQLDGQLGGRPCTEWTLELDYEPLWNGFLGAIQKEVLTLYHPAQFQFRRTQDRPVTIVDSNGISHLIPPKTLTPINFAAAFRNPRLWRERREITPPSRRMELSDSPALYFNPDRWLGTKFGLDAAVNGAGMAVPEWYAFGQGPRQCPGRAFAQIELAAAMATLFKDYSLELVMDDETLARHGGDRKAAREKTRDKGIKMMYDDIEANISIGLHKELPLRIVKRADMEI